jgi:hypothetical protein
MARMTGHDNLEEYRTAAIAVRAAFDKIQAIQPPSTELLAGDPQGGVDPNAFAQADDELQRAEAQLNEARRKLDG